MVEFTRLKLSGKDFIIYEPNAYALIKASHNFTLKAFEFPDVSFVYFVFAEVIFVNNKPIGIDNFLQLHYEDYLQILDVTNVLFTKLGELQK